VGAHCATCLGWYLPSQLDVDHIKPLALGGEDVEDNVQALCKRCHKTKTAMDFGKRPF
jgi:5-methylcytosine-specific restriction protein A